MIKNIIFDFGQVLVKFDPSYMTEKYVKDAESAACIRNVLFDRLYWDRLDLGTISDSELLECVCARLPKELHGAAAKIYENWFYNLPETEGMRELLKELKKEFNVNLYLLSNISKGFSIHRSKIPILKYFDACIMSADYGFVKPEREIFEILCRECRIKKEESIFIDDSPKNTAGAKAFGIDTYLFDGDTSALRRHLLEILDKNKI